MIDRSKKLPAFFYQTSGGNEPVREWILELSPEDRKIIGRDIQKVEFGWPIGMPYCRSLGEGLWEVRSDLTDGKDRASDFLCRGRSHGVAARFHQEDAEDAGARFAGRAETYEGGVLMAQRKGRMGSSFDSFLAEQGILEECEEQAIKQILADQIKAAMEKDHLTKSAMAERMRTSRRALDRLLDPANTSVTLHTLQRAAAAVGRQLRLELI